MAFHQIGTNSENTLIFCLFCQFVFASHCSVSIHSSSNLIQIRVLVVISPGRYASPLVLERWSFLCQDTWVIYLRKIYDLRVIFYLLDSRVVVINQLLNKDPLVFFFVFFCWKRVNIVCLSNTLCWSVEPTLKKHCLCSVLCQHEMNRAELWPSIVYIVLLILPAPFENTFYDCFTNVLKILLQD